MSLVALLVALSLPAGAAAPLTLTITDPAVIAVVLECGTETQKALVKNGIVEFLQAPKGRCEVNVVRKSGAIDGPGQYTCGLEGCRLDEVLHLPVSNAPGRVNIIVTAGLEPSASLEVNCPSGYRERASFTDNTATFEKIPDEQCLLLFKGGTPARYNGLRWGTYFCSLTGTTAVCTQR